MTKPSVSAFEEYQWFLLVIAGGIVLLGTIFGWPEQPKKPAGDPVEKVGKAMGNGSRRFAKGWIKGFWSKGEGK